MAQSWAQPMFYFRNLDVSKGLPSNVVHSFCQDQQGFMWIGTKDGLVRYDGVSFETFFTDPAVNTSIGGNNISWDIQEDHFGRIWITLHGKGLSRYDPQSGAFTNFSYANGKFPEEWTNDVQHLIVEPEGSVLLVCQKGIVQIDGSDSASVLIDLKAELPDPGSIRAGVIHKEKKLWFSTTRGFLMYDLLTKTWFDRQHNPSDLKILSADRGAHGFEYHKGKIWFSTFFKPVGNHRFLYSFDIDRNHLDSIPIAPEIAKKNPFSDQVHAIQIQENGTIWLGTEGIGLMGLLSYDPNAQEWVQYLGNTDWTGSILPGPVRTMYPDHDGNMWIGTDRGVSLMAPDRQYFMNYAETVDVEGNSISLAELHSLVTGSDGDIWAHTDGAGMLQFGADKKVKRVWKDLPKTNGSFRNYLEPRLIQGDTFIFHAWYNGLLRLNLKNGDVFPFAPETDVGYPEIRDVFRSRSNQVYAYGWGRFGKLNIHTGQFDFVSMELNSDQLNDLVTSTTEDENGNIWLGLGQNGLLCLDPNSLSVINSWTRDTARYRKTTVWDVVSQNGKIYFTMNKEGLAVLDVATKEVVNYTKKDGVSSDELGGVIVDDKGDVWVYGSSGISWFDEKNGRFRNFNEADGMISENVRNAVSHLNGQIVLATNRGLISFDPERLKAANNHEKPSLRSIQVYDQVINLHKWKRDSATITIPHDQNYLRVEFSALEFFDPEKIRFAYRLEGAEERWNYTDHQPVAIYTNLRGGDYQLCVKRTNTDGAWGPELCVPILVTTPFYRQAWFIVLAILVAVFVSYLVYRWQLRKKLAVLEVRNQLSRDLHDDIGSALSSINIFSSVAERQLESDTIEAQKLLQRIGSSARGMMQSMDDIIWSIDPKNDQLEQLISRMRGFAVPILEAKDILIKMKVDDNVKSVRLEMVKRRNLFLIFKEAINNLAKYSEAKTTQVDLSVSSGTLEMSIKDDGIGFDVEAKTDRHGLKNMRERAEEIGGQASIISEINKGTTITVRIPIT